MSKPPEDDHDKTIYGDPLATLIPILLVLVLVSGWVLYLARPNDQRTPVTPQERNESQQ
jgi:hypothetical protein